MILAGDIGGTKTVLALFSKEKGVSGGTLHETRFESSQYGALEEIITVFLRQTGARPTAASFGVAGPVNGQQARITNLPWTINGDSIRNSFAIPQVLLLNDLEAIATAVPHLESKDLHTLNRGEAVPDGNIGVVAPGTGLGTAFLVWTGDGYKACASEGGHSSFSPSNLLQVELLTYLQKRYGHVSFERVCSGGQLPNIYDFFIEQGEYLEPDWLREELANADDRTPVIVRNGLADEADICVATLDMFVQVLGTVLGNMAVTLLPGGGIYLGGGIPPRILERLQEPDFMEAVTDKGRFATLCANIPVHVILAPRAALHGAAWFAMETLSRRNSP